MIIEKPTFNDKRFTFDISNSERFFLYATIQKFDRKILNKYTLADWGAKKIYNWQIQQKDIKSISYYKMFLLSIDNSNFDSKNPKMVSKEFYKYPGSVNANLLSY